MPKKILRVKTSMYLDRDLYLRLRQVSEKHMIPMAKLFRKALRKILEEYH